MATELPQPGVEVVQEFTSASPTIVSPTLVPCVVAPFFEIIDALESDGTVNDDAKLSSSYDQLEQTVLQSSFPSPRGNIDEVDVQEDSIRAFFEFGGALRELSKESAFLTSFLDPEVAKQPYVDGTTTETSTAGGYDIDGRTLVVALDSHTAIPPAAPSLPASKNVTITFSASTPGGRLSLAEVVSQINAVLPGVASATGDVLRLTSTKYGAGASVVVRSSGSANSGTDRLGFDAASDTFAVGSGFYARDDSDGDATSPRLKIYDGLQQGTIAAPGAPQLGVLPSFLDANIEVGDDLVADGVAIGKVANVEAELLTMEVEQKIMSQGSKFAPRRVWVEANNLTYPAPAASSAATQTGSVQADVATVAYVVGAVAFSGTAEPSETLSVDVTVGGVAQATETVTSGAGDWDTIGNAIASINGQATNFEAYEADATGTESAAAGFLAFRTKAANTGSGAGITITSSSVAADLGYTTLPVSDIGENIRYDAGGLGGLNGKTFEWYLDGNPKMWSIILQKDEDDDGVSLQGIVDRINALTPNVASATSDRYLKLTSQKVGEASQVKIGAGTANADLGFVDSTSVSGSGRPAPDLALDSSGNVILQGQLLRDGLTGMPFNPGLAPIIVSYKGLRLDLSPDADNPALLVFEDTDTLEDSVGPISPENPGALMAYLALLNAPSTTVAGIGVSEVSADAPDGTPKAYASCAEFLESEEVYALSTASQLSTVHQTFLTHVKAMSEADQKGERIYFFNPETPDRANPTLIGSGTDLNTTVNENECTVEVNLAPALIAAGIDPNLAINPDTGAIQHELYLDIGDDDKYYLIKEVDSGTTVKLRTSFSTGDGNSDSFYSTTTFPTTVVSDDWTVYLRGQELLTAGRPDRQKIAETIQKSAQGYGSRRGFYVFPDQVGINVTGLEQVVKGYFATAAITGMVGQLPPQQGFSGYPITGLTRPVGSNDKFTNRQLNVMAAGGVYILVQDAVGAPVNCRHQLSTDTTSIETRELSITKVVDFGAKFMRAGLRNFIGRSNITQGFLDSLSSIVQGQLDFLVEGGVLIGADINNLIQDADNPDTILIDVTLDVPFPANYIRLTLIV